MIGRLRILLGWPLFGLIVLAGWIVYGVTRSETKAKRVVARGMGEVAARFIGIRVRVVGHAHLPVGESAVYVANHQSHADQLILAHVARHIGDLVIIAKMRKGTVWGHPFFDGLFRRLGNISIEAETTGSNAHALLLARDQVRQGRSLGIFPQGTRRRFDPDGLGPFRRGAFLVAVDCNVPIVPIVVSPLGRVDIEGGSSGAQEVEVRILDPIRPTGAGRREVDALKEEVRHRMEAELRAMVDISY